MYGNFAQIRKISYNIGITGILANYNASESLRKGKNLHFSINPYIITINNIFFLP